MKVRKFKEGDILVCINTHAWVLQLDLETLVSGPPVNHEVVLRKYGIYGYYGTSIAEWFIIIQGYRGLYPESCFVKKKIELNAFDKLLEKVVSVPKPRKEKKTLAIA